MISMKDIITHDISDKNTLILMQNLKRLEKLYSQAVRINLESQEILRKEKLNFEQKFSSVREEQDKLLIIINNKFHTIKTGEKYNNVEIKRYSGNWFKHGESMISNNFKLKYNKKLSIICLLYTSRCV